MPAPAPIPPPQLNLDWRLINSQLGAYGYTITKTSPQLGTAPAASAIASELDNTFGSRSRIVFDPERPLLQVRWCKRPERGTPGRSEFKLRILLGMTKPGWRFLRAGMRDILRHDPDINMNKAFTYNDQDTIKRIAYDSVVMFPEFELFRRQKFWPLTGVIQVILKNSSDKYNTARRELKAEAEATARGEVVEPKSKKVNPPTTARGKAKVKEAKAKTNSPVRVPVDNDNDNDNNDNDNDNDSINNNNNNDNGNDNDLMETSFSQAPMGVEDDIAEVTHNMSVMAVDLAQDDEPDEMLGSILAQLSPQAASTPLPAPISTRPSKPPHTVQPSAPSRAISVPIPAPAATLAPGPMITSMTTPALAPAISSAPPASGTPELFIQLAQLAALAPEAQRALIPAEVWRLLIPANLSTPDPTTMLTPTSNLASDSPAGVSQPVHTASDHSDGDLTDPPSASESNPPIEEDKPSNVWEKAPKTKKAAAKGKKVPPSYNDEAGSAGILVAKTAKAVKAAKAANVTNQVDGDSASAPSKQAGGKGKGKAVAIAIDDEDEHVNVKPATRKVTRHATNSKRGGKK